MEEEPVKYFSLPRPKYNRNPDQIVPDPVELVKVKYRANAENFRQKRVGGRRFTVDVTSNDVETALSDVGQQKKISRSISTLNKPVYDEIKIRTLTLPKQAKKQPIIEEDENEGPKGPEFIVNSTADVMTVDIGDNKVNPLSSTLSNYPDPCFFIM